MIACAPCFAADWFFLPRSTRTQLFFEAFGSVERDELSSSARKLEWKDVFTKERLAVESNGYWYDPRFLQYQLSAGFALKQEDYESSDVAPLGRRTGSGWDYDARLTLLPEHAYNLSLFSSRLEPVVRNEFSTRRNSLETRRGAVFRFRDSPYFFHVAYVNDAIETGDESSDVAKLSADARYSRQLRDDRSLSFSGSAERSTFTGTSGLDGTLVEYHLGNDVGLDRLRLSSTLSDTSTHQDAPVAGTYGSDQLLWQERLTVSMPWRLRGDATYRYERNASRFDASGLPDRSFTETGHVLEANLIHRLYESLDTTYTLIGSDRSSPGGETTSLSNAIAFNYSKSIPRGTILAGLSAGTARTASNGRGTDIVDEAHSAIYVPTQTFSLNQQDVQGESIVVFLRSPLPPFEAILLQRDANYTVRALPDLNTFEILVITLPPQFVVPGYYDFLVSYSLAGGDFTIRSDNYGLNGSVELFDNLLTPYFSYFDVSSHILSGSFPGNPVDSRSYIAGVRTHRGLLSAFAEYQRLVSDVSPYTSSRVEVQLSGSAGPTTSIYGSAGYATKHYQQGRAEFDGRGFDESRESVAATIQQQLFARSLAISLGGSYSRIQSEEDSSAYSGTASLDWKVGKLEVSAGVTTYSVDAGAGTTVATRRNHMSCFVRIRRTFF